jgi:hypothetical protein
METEALYGKHNKNIENLFEKQKIKMKNQLTNQNQNVYQSTINVTNTKFAKEELTILNYGLQHSLKQPLKTYWLNLIIEREKAIKLLDNKLQNAFRILASKILKQIYNTSNNTSALHKRHLYVVNKIKQKIVTGNAMLAQADKHRTTVIIYKYNYA